MVRLFQRGFTKQFPFPSQETQLHHSATENAASCISFTSYSWLGAQRRCAFVLKVSKALFLKVYFITLCARLLKTILQKTENIHAFKCTLHEFKSNLLH